MIFIDSEHIKRIVEFVGTPDDAYMQGITNTSVRKRESEREEEKECVCPHLIFCRLDIILPLSLTTQRKILLKFLLVLILML